LEFGPSAKELPGKLAIDVAALSQPIQESHKQKVWKLNSGFTERS